MSRDEYFSFPLGVIQSLYLQSTDGRGSLLNCLTFLKTPGTQYLKAQENATFDIRKKLEKFCRVGFMFSSFAGMLPLSWSDRQYLP